MSQSRTTPRNASVAPLYAAQAQRTPARRRAGALLMGTALSAVIGLGYGRGAYAQVASGVLTTANASTVEIDGPGLFETQDGFSVDAASGDGITITTASGATGDTTFTDNYASTITGAVNGIIGRNQGSGALTVTTNGTVSGSDGDGVFARNGAYVDEDSDGNPDTYASGGYTKYTSAGTALTITTRSDVTGSDNGIRGYNSGTGALSITADGNVDGESAVGIYATNRVIDGTGSFNVPGGPIYYATYTGAGTDLTITANGDITGSTDGINADNFGSGALSVTTTGIVTGTAQSGIYARNSESGTNLIIKSGNIYAGSNGILANNYGDGYVSVDAYGEINSGEDGIQVNSDVEQATTVISHSNISAGGYGINVVILGSGGGSVTALSDITATDGGIYADNSGGSVTITADAQVSGGTKGIAVYNSGTDLTITANGSVTGGTTGIYADNDGSGALSITTTGTGTVTGTAEDGIYAYNSSAGTDLTIVANTVTGGTDGIYAYNDGSGALSITANGTVTGNGGNGVYAANRGSDILIEVDAVTALSAPIRVIQRGSGYIDVTSNGVIEATGSGSDGIDIDNGFGQDGVDLTINGDVIAPRRGVNIETRPESAGAVNVALNGTITSSSVGVFVEQEADANVDLSIEGDIVSSGNDGIDVRHLADGDIIIVASGDISAGGNYGEGIETQHSGTGSTQIAAYGTITAAIAEGIDARQAGGDSLTITANNVTGGTYGIYADNDGSGALSITTTGTVTGTAEDGIYANNSSAGTDLTIVADTVTGGMDGIFANNDGSGALSITTTGTVTGTASNGIDADNSDNGTNLMINVSDVRGDRDALTATNRGNGYVYVLATGEVYSASGRGIDVVNDNGTSLSISANNVTAAGSQHGIFARNDGSGNLSITSTGTITAGSDGVNALVDTVSTGDAIISVNDVSAEFHGIEITNRGSGSTTIEVNGTVESATQDGIYANNKTSTEDLTITIAEGGSVSTSGTDDSDFAIEAVANNGAVIVNNFGTVTGRVNLTNSNTFTNAGTWDLAGTTSNFNAQGNSLVVNEGLIIAASDAEVNEWPWLDNLDTFRNNAGGTIRLADGGAGDVFEIGNSGGQASADFVANGGTVELDVVLGGDGSAADRLDISGDVVLDAAPTALAFTPVGGGTGGETTTGIEVVTVGGTSDAGAFVLAAPAEVGALSYDLSLGQCDDTADANWYLCNSGTIGTTGAVFEALPSVVLNGFTRTETLQQRLGARVTSREMATVTASTQGEADLPVAQSVGPWMRGWGDFADITPDSSTAGTSWEADSWGMEAGIGTILGDHAAGTLVGGINLRYGATYADLSNPVGTGSINAEGVGLAASLTWFGNDGLYVDGNAAVDFVSIDATSQGGGELLNDHDDVVYSASAEVGKRIELQGGTTLVPQAQLSWGKMRDGSLTDNLGNVVSFADRETLTSRIGLTVEQDLGDTDLGSGTVFAFANVLNDLSGSRRVSVAGADLSQNGAGDWFELGGGVSLQPSETTSLFGQVSYREAFDGVRGDAIALSAGLRMEW